MATSDALEGVTEEDLKGEQSADGSSCETLKVVESEISLSPRTTRPARHLSIQFPRNLILR